MGLNFELISKGPVFEMMIKDGHSFTAFIEPTWLVHLVKIPIDFKVSTNLKWLTSRSPKKVAFPT